MGRRGISISTPQYSLAKDYREEGACRVFNKTGEDMNVSSRQISHDLQSRYSCRLLGSAAYAGGEAYCPSIF